MKIPRITSEVYQIGGPGLSAADDADILCEGHYGIIEGVERVRAFIRRFLP